MSDVLFERGKDAHHTHQKGAVADFGDIIFRTSSSRHLMMIFRRLLQHPTLRNLPTYSDRKERLHTNQKQA